ncbi:UNVERIFIED_CONTAM: TPR repeat-containing protein ZIP4 [Sesamum calycinum]|uniref:Protein ZIP4 homolog n=1 Tax=Sesamum calycinum TaxID=2727403 RepID=A0AAW2SBY2_9LAMI
MKVRANVVTELVTDERVVAVFDREGAAKERTTMHALLWNCATEHFRSKEYLLSAEMFEKSMLYVPHGMENRILRAKGYRVLCLCYLGLLQLDRAEEYINEAEKLEPNIASSFLKFKIFLQKNDHDRAIAQMQAMPSCLDFTTDFISLSAHEAVACRCLPVATASLSQLLNFIPLENQCQLMRYMKQARSRLSEIGPDLFFGKCEVGRREKNWFAGNAWNSGVRTGQEKNYELSAEFFKLASEFFGVVGDGETEGNDLMVCKSIIMAVSAIIAGEKHRKCTLLETEVRQAIDLLGRAGKILMSASGSIRQIDDQTAAIEPNFFFMYTWCSFDLYSRLSDLSAQQLSLVKTFASSKSCNPKHLLHIGLEASQGPRSNPEVCTFALNTCLASLLASPSPDYQTVALVLRKLISVSTIYKRDTEDDSITEIYKQAYRIMVGLRKESIRLKKPNGWL